MDDDSRERRHLSYLRGGRPSARADHRRLSIRALFDVLKNWETVRKMLQRDLNLWKICEKIIPKFRSHKQS